MAKKGKKNSTSITLADVGALSDVLALEPNVADGNGSMSPAEIAAEPMLNPIIVAIEAEAAALPDEPEVVHATVEEAIEAIEDDGVDFAQITSAIDADTVAEQVENISGQLDAREAFEDIKSSTTGKSNIHRTLKKVRGDLVRSHAAMVMIAAHVDASFINRTIHDGSCYNVYALGKFSDLVDALTGNTMGNAINIAIVRTLFAFKTAGKAFTKDTALAAASDKIRYADVSARSMIVAHTVSASTAPTQASSTMQALETLGIVKTVGGSRKNPTYQVCNNAQARAMEAVALAFAA